jgi:hypothetical protein
MASQFDGLSYMVLLQSINKRGFEDSRGQVFVLNLFYKLFEHLFNFIYTVFCNSKAFHSNP